MRYFWTILAGIVSGAVGLVVGTIAYESYFKKTTKALPPSTGAVDLPESREDMQDLKGFVESCMTELDLTIEGDVPVDEQDAEDAIEDLRLCVLEQMYPTIEFPPKGTVHASVWQAYSIVGAMARDAVFDLMDEAENEKKSFTVTATDKPTTAGVTATGPIGSGQATGPITSAEATQDPFSATPQQSPFQGGIGW